MKMFLFLSCWRRLVQIDCEDGPSVQFPIETAQKPATTGMRTFQEGADLKQDQAALVESEFNIRRDLPPIRIA